MLAKTDIEQIKLRSDLLAIVEQDLGPARRRNGRWFGWPCPFHADGDRDGGSLRVTPDVGTWFCFGCQKSGDAISWLRERHNLSFAEACQHLGSPNSLLPFAPRPLTFRQQAGPPPIVWQQRIKQLAEQCQNNLWTGVGNRARRYLAQRNLNDATICQWQIGYNPSRFVDKELEGLNGEPVKISQGITIPIWQNGQLWSLKIRQEDGYTPKYVQVLGGRTTLFGASTLKKPVAVLVEGEFDAMLLLQEAGDLVGVASTTGGAATWQREWSFRLLAVQEILVAYDSDHAGEMAAHKVISLTSRARRVNVPSGSKDVTEFWQAGGNLRQWVQDLIARPPLSAPIGTPPLPACPICGGTDWRSVDGEWVCAVCA